MLVSNTGTSHVAAATRSPRFSAADNLLNMPVGVPGNARAYPVSHNILLKDEYDRIMRHGSKFSIEVAI